MPVVPGSMFAVVAGRCDPAQPLSGLRAGRHPEPTVPNPDWTVVEVAAAALNHHGLWTLRGVGVRSENLPIVLGSDGVGVDGRGQAVMMHSVVGEAGHGLVEGEAPSILAERYDGTFAERVAIPSWNLLAIPPEFSFEEAACLPGAYLTAYRMLIVEAEVRAGDTVLVQGAGGGMATALILLGRAAGARVWVTSRSEHKLARAVQLGAHVGYATGAPLPAQVDAVMETVGAATWGHSITSLRPGGTLVVSGATSGTDVPDLMLDRIAEKQLRIVGVTLGSRHQLAGLVEFCLSTGLRPLIDTVLPLHRARAGFEQMITGNIYGKIVFRVSPGATVL